MFQHVKPKTYKPFFFVTLMLLISFSSLLAKAQEKQQEKPTLNVYTYDSFVTEWGPGDKLKAHFETQCECQLKFISAADGVSIVNRLRIEGTKTQADIILGIDEFLMQNVIEMDLIAPHGVDTSTIKEELNWRNTDFVPFDYGYFSFIYDSENIKNPATSLQELVLRDINVIYQDPRTSTVGQGLLVWMNSVFKDKADFAWKQLSKRTVTVTKGWSEAYSIFLDGGADYVLSYHTSPAYHIANEQTSRYKAAQFKEGHIRQIELAAMLNRSKHPILAKQFLQFLLSAQAQQIIATHNWMLPVVENIELPKAFDQLSHPHNLPLDLSLYSTHRQLWLTDWRNAVSGK